MKTLISYIFSAMAGLCFIAGVEVLSGGERHGYSG